MKNKALFSVHFAAVSALFILGTAVINLPRENADRYTFLVYMAVSVALVGVSFLILPLLSKVFGGDTVLLRWISVAVYTASAVYALFCAGGAFSDFIKFAGKILLPDTSRSVIIAVFLLVAVYFCTKKQESVLKFFLLSFALCLIFIVFFFFATAYNYNLRNIFIFSLPNFKTFISGAKPYFTAVFLPSLLLPVYNLLVFDNKRGSAYYCGTAIGTAVLGFCILSPLLLFGADLAGKMDYPYAAAVSTVTVGRIFTRMDGFSYFIYFASALCKICVCVFIIRSSLKRINGILKK